MTRDDLKRKKVSVIVPNYNYSRYLSERFSSIVQQSYPIHEIVILDDASTDDSLDKITEFMETTDISIKLIVNEKNSGSVFSQWIKGIEASQGEFIWIAEADDSCDPDFLSEVMQSFDDPEVVLSYTLSRLIDSDGKTISENNLKYTDNIDKNRWKSGYIRDGRDEIRDTLVIQNTIHNVSSVVFKRFDLAPIKEKVLSFKVAGDWYLYSRILENGKIRLIPKPLNYWRIHTESVCATGISRQTHYREIIEVQEDIYKRYRIDSGIWAQALGFREKTRLNFQIYHPSVERYLFIMTYGESGSEKLMKLLNDCEGVEIRGENMDLLSRLYQGFLAVKQTKSFSFNRFYSDYTDKPWYGAHLLEPVIFGRKLCSLFVSDVLRPSETAVVTGFKEIRFLDKSEDWLEGYIEFLFAFFPDSRIVFYRRDLNAVARSGWFAKEDPRIVLPKLEKLDSWMVKMAGKSQDRIVMIDNEELAGAEKIPDKIYETCIGKRLK